jgi:hypothetical protein
LHPAVGERKLVRQDDAAKEKSIVTWTQLLKNEVESAYTTTAKLLERVSPDSLGWKPETGTNWMTVGQLLKHISDACGAACKAFVTDEWGLTPGVKFEDLPPEEVLPPADKLPTIDSVESARKLLCEDQGVALQMIDQAGEDELDHRMMAAPWAPGKEYPLGWHLLQMVRHLDRHKAQLFYYLKLRGEPVSTVDLWGQ